MPRPRSRRTLTSKTTVFFAAVVLACSGDDPTEPVDPLDVRVSPSHVFAGGEVFLVGDWYRASGKAYSLSLDTVSLAVRRVNDSTVGITVPPGKNGVATLVERIGGTDIQRASLEVYGLARIATIPMPVQAQFTPSQNPAVPYAVTGDSGGVSVISLRTDLVKRYPGIGRLGYELGSCHRIAGPSYADGAFLIWDSTPYPSMKATRWQLIPDTLRGQALFPPGATCGMAEVSPQVFMHTGSQGGAAFVSLDSIDDAGNRTNFYSDVVISNKGFFWSGSRMVLRGTNNEGVSVIDLQARARAFVVPWMRTVHSAAFSIDGTAIYLCGYGPLPSLLISVSAATGDSLAAKPGSCLALAIDPQLGVLYTLAGGTDGTSVLVLNPVTLGEVGRINLTSMECVNCEESVISVDRANGELVVLHYLLSQSGIGLAHVRIPPEFP